MNTERSTTDVLQAERLSQDETLAGWVLSIANILLESMGNYVCAPYKKRIMQGNASTPFELQDNLAMLEEADMRTTHQLSKKPRKRSR